MMFGSMMSTNIHSHAIDCPLAEDVPEQQLQKLCQSNLCSGALKGGPAETRALFLFYSHKVLHFLLFFRYFPLFCHNKHI